MNQLAKLIISQGKVPFIQMIIMNLLFEIPIDLYSEQNIMRRNCQLDFANCQLYQKIMVQ